MAFTVEVYNKENGICVDHEDLVINVNGGRYGRDR